ncbi:MAG TPA: methionine adenosyltransferase [Bacteroidales bacterium]|nr:MAG: methionine adenosyltransferase [Bacteroidetes bacterium GWE2_42_24]OFY31336.1 MAG: methionine adenosyltransferase [Bacteroidetes bacterium GWF2_43_11]PKP24439.1 MAG: methionine adenosyltransferase [Bacteroidetes bacterium HGW-Bacteroidetes-22]HBZ67795.1 methionine adenosyltransferase [Bacteroidales bacterium]
MGFFFTSESVSEGHPDKVADQISDSLLDEFLRYDPNSKVACETLVTTGLTVCSGEVRTNGYVDIQDIARSAIKKIGYTKGEYRFESESCGVISTIHEQSGDINQGVDRATEEEMGAGDQGMMFGYACNETDNLMPLPVELAHMLVQELAAIRREGKLMTYLRPDSKSQVTVEYENRWKATRIDTIVLSTQHDEFDQDEKMLAKIEADVRHILIPRVKALLPLRIQVLFGDNFKLYVNPTGKFVIGGPHGDTGLTGRKIIVDTYGGRGAHGGGAFSGKDSSKVDRSAAYAMRHIAKNMVAAGLCEEVLVQVAYAIGIARPVGLFIDTYGTCKATNEKGEVISDEVLADKMLSIFDLRPFAIISRFGLRNPIFVPSAAYGHFGRTPYEAEVEVKYKNHETICKSLDGVDRYFKKVNFFAWEKTDYIDKLKQAFNI